MKLAKIDLDDHFLKALEYLSECINVALGIDSSAFNKSAIQKIKSFS